MSAKAMVKLYWILDLAMTIMALLYLFILRDLTNGLLFWIVSEIFAARRRDYEALC
jgi:hypothetical protein